MRRPPAFTSSRRLVRSTQPADRRRLPSSRQGSSTGGRGGVVRASGSRYRAGFLGDGAKKSFDPHTNAPGVPRCGSSARSSAGMASTCAQLSPVSTTRSGRSDARSRTQSTLRCWPGVRCRSDRCRTRSGSWPCGSTGTVTSRSAYQRDSTSVPQATAAAPASAAPPSARATGWVIRRCSRRRCRRRRCRHRGSRRCSRRPRRRRPARPGRSTASGRSSCPPARCRTGSG